MDVFDFDEKDESYLQYTVEDRDEESPGKRRRTESNANPSTARILAR
jgi:hypothetical protein